MSFQIRQQSLSIVCFKCHNPYLYLVTATNLSVPLTTEFQDASALRRCTRSRESLSFLRRGCRKVRSFRSQRATRSIRAIGGQFTFFHLHGPYSELTFETRSSWFLPLAGREAIRAWMLTNDASYRLAGIGGRNLDPRSLFRRGFQEQGICGFVVSVLVARPRLLGSHKSVLLLSRSEFIRLDSAESSSPRQKRSRPVTESQTIYSLPLSPFATFSICPRISNS